MPDSNLPTLRPSKFAWDRIPPDPLQDPDLYDGLVWRRVLGYGADVVLIGAAYFCAWLAFGVLGILTLGLSVPLSILVLAALPAAYHTYFIGRRGMTPGMRLFDLEIRSWTGGRPDYLQAFLVTVLFYVTVAATAWLVLLVALFNDRRRTLHDLLAGTVVVRHSRLSEASILPPGDGGPARGPNPLWP